MADSETVMGTYALAQMEARIEDLRAEVAFLRGLVGIPADEGVESELRERLEDANRTIRHLEGQNDMLARSLKKLVEQTFNSTSILKTCQDAPDSPMKADSSGISCSNMVK